MFNINFFFVVYCKLYVFENLSGMLCLSVCQVYCKEGEQNIMSMIFLRTPESSLIGMLHAQPGELHLCTVLITKPDNCFYKNQIFHGIRWMLRHLSSAVILRSVSGSELKLVSKNKVFHTDIKCT